MVLAEQRPLGCSRCRYSKNGCSRCRNSAFKPRAVRQQLLAEGKPTQHIVGGNSSSLPTTSHDGDSDGGIPRYSSASRRSKRVPARSSSKSGKRKAGNNRTQHKQQGPIKCATNDENLQRQEQTTGYAAQGRHHQQQQQSLTVIAAGDCCEQQQQQGSAAQSHTLQQQQQQQSQHVQKKYGFCELQQHTQQQQQQQHSDYEQHTIVHAVDTRDPLRRGSKRLNTNDTAISLTKRLRTALRLQSTPPAAAAAGTTAEPAAGVEASNPAVVPAEAHALLPSSDAAAAAGLGSGRPAYAADDEHFVTDGGARKHGAAAAAAAGTAGEITPFDLDQAATATTAAAAAAAAAAPADFNRLLQQRIQQQLAQGRQPLLPTKRSAAAAAGSSPAATKHSRRAGTPTQQQQQQQQVADPLSLSPLSPAAAAELTNSSSSSADSTPLTAAAAAAAPTPSPQTLPRKRQIHKTPTVKTTKIYKAPKPYTHLALPGINPRVCVPGWSPPVSPYGLLEEELWQDPWKLLLACMLLNKTSGKQVRIVLWDLLALCPTPAAAAAADTAAIRDIIYPLGLYNKRAVAVQRLSHDFIHKDWSCPTELYGIGKYAADAYYIFCRGQWQGVQPDDKDLIKYHEWLRATGGLGTGLTGPQSVVVESG